jgi:hypothetical protein
MEFNCVAPPSFAAASNPVQSILVAYAPYGKTIGFMAKYRHRFFEMYDFRDEAVGDLMPRTPPAAGTGAAVEIPAFQHLVISRAAGVTLVEFKSPETFGEAQVKEVSDELSQLADSVERHCKIVMDFSGIESLPAGFIDALMAFHGKLKIKGSRMAICDLQPAAREAFFAPR